MMSYGDSHEAAEIDHMITAEELLFEAKLIRNVCLCQLFSAVLQTFI